MALLEPLAEPVGTIEGKKETNETEKKKGMVSAKRPSLPGGTPYTLMIANRVCVCVCVP